MSFTLTPPHAITGASPSFPSPVTGSWLHRIACISTSRSDAGIYEPLLTALSEVEPLDITLLAGGTHLSDLHGHTLDDLPAIPRVRIHPVAHQATGDDPCSVAETAGRAVIEFARALEEAAPDLVFVLGDRTEMLAASLAAQIRGVPIAHLHGGDTTEGAYDDACRHAITKLSHLHLPALPEHARRIASMAEAPWRIHCVGAPALDALRRFRPLSRGELGRRLGLDLSRPMAVVIFHPETITTLTPERQIEELLAALEGSPLKLLIIGPNADVGRDAIADAWCGFVRRRPDAVVAASLAREMFWSCLAHAAVLIGNSSAGLIEAASFRLPVVNIGNRQQGRLRPANVIDAPLDRSAVGGAIRTALDPSFRVTLAGMTNPYGDGHAAERIVHVLARLPDRQRLLRKP